MSRTGKSIETEKRFVVVGKKRAGIYGFPIGMTEMF
jgi:hypothetical protein